MYSSSINTIQNNTKQFKVQM